MSENPYRLARDIRGIGFKTADAIIGASGATLAVVPALARGRTSSRP